jgi:hypothetical protein
MHPLKPIDLLDYHSFEQYLIYKKQHPLFLDLITRSKLSVAGICIDYTRVVLNELVYRPFSLEISNQFIYQLYHLYLNHDLQAIIDFLYTYHALSYS